MPIQRDPQRISARDREENEVLFWRDSNVTIASVNRKLRVNGSLAHARAEDSSCLIAPLEQHRSFAKRVVEFSHARHRRAINALSNTDLPHRGIHTVLRTELARARIRIVNGREQQ